MKNFKIVSKNSISPINDLGEAACIAIAEQINPILADAFTLYLKTKNYHWHIRGQNYRDFHLLLDEQSAQILAMVDVLAERIRKLGGKTLRSISQIIELQHLHDDNEEDLPPMEMIRRLMADNKIFTGYLRKAHDVTSEHRDVATTSLLENYIDESEHRVWFLYEILN